MNLNSNKHSYHSFSLAFLLVGFPSIFAIREVLPIPSDLFTYGSISILLLLLFNFRNLINIKLYSEQNITLDILFLTLFLLFLLHTLFTGDLKENIPSIIYITVLMVIFIGLRTRKIEEYNDLPFQILFVSSITTLITVLLTPLDINYWLAEGSRLYVGDTQNPNITAFSALLNVLSIFFYIINNKIPLLLKILLLLIAGLSIYLYSLAFSKSAIIGFIFALILLLPNKFYKKKSFLSYIIYISILGFILTLIFPEVLNVLEDKLETLSIAFDRYFYGDIHAYATDSSAMRHENVKQKFALLNKISLFSGNGMFTTRADFPILQVFTDLGFIMGSLNLFVMFLIPTFIFIKQLYSFQFLDNSSFKNLLKIVTIIYLFFLPNLLLHGSAYDFAIWIPIVILYRFVPLGTKYKFQKYSKGKICKI